MALSTVEATLLRGHITLVASDHHSGPMWVALGHRGMHMLHGETPRSRYPRARANCVDWHYTMPNHDSAARRTAQTKRYLAMYAVL